MQAAAGTADYQEVAVGADAGEAQSTANPTAALTPERGASTSSPATGPDVASASNDAAGKSRSTATNPSSLAAAAQSLLAETIAWGTFGPLPGARSSGASDAPKGSVPAGAASGPPAAAAPSGASKQTADTRSPPQPRHRQPARTVRQAARRNRHRAPRRQVCPPWPTRSSTRPAWRSTGFRSPRVLPKRRLIRRPTRPARRRWIRPHQPPTRSIRMRLSGRWTDAVLWPPILPAPALSATWPTRGRTGPWMRSRRCKGRMAAEPPQSGRMPPIPRRLPSSPAIFKRPRRARQAPPGRSRPAAAFRLP